MMNLSKNSDRKAIWGWSLYDFGNSAFTTLVVTFIFASYFTKAIAPDVITGTVLWSRAVTISALIVAVIAPVAGAFADQAKNRKTMLFVATYVSIIATVALYNVLPGQVITALVVFIIANIGYELGGVFYNSFLADLAPTSRIGRTSGNAWALGYLGGLLALVIALVGFVNPEVPWFGFTKEAGQNIRATNLLVAVWFGIFTLPMFLWVKEPGRAKAPSDKGIISATFGQLRATMRSLGNYRQLTKFLIARMIYNDGLVTIFAFGGIYAAGTFGFSFQEIIIFGIGMNVSAGLGAWLMGYIDDARGARKTIQISLVGLVAASLLGALAWNKTVFWIAGMLIGLFVGPNQAASRSLMARYSPAHLKAEFFGFFAMSGKATAFAGPLALGILTDIFNSQRAGIWVVVVLFGMGLLLLNSVDEQKILKESLENKS